MNARRLRNLILLPIALVLVVLEDVVWAGLLVVVRALNALPPLRRLAAWLGTLPGWIALPLFLIPEVLGRVGEFWALALLVQGDVALSVVIYLGVRLIATLIAVFVYQSCAAALHSYAWFATLVRWLLLVKDWAVGLIAPWRAWWRSAIGRTRSRVAWRFAALRRAYAIGLFRRDRE